MPTIRNILRLNSQAPRPSPNVDTQSDPEWFDNSGGITDASEEPPTSDIDTPALSTTSSVVSIDANEETKSLHHKRKLSISLSGNGKLIHKFPRRENEQVWSGNAEGGQSGNSDKHTGSTNPDDTATETCSHLQQPRIGHKVQHGASRSASTSRKLRKAVASGNYVIQEKR